jgi:hypothetical protein
MRRQQCTSHWPLLRGGVWGGARPEGTRSAPSRVQGQESLHARPAQAGGARSTAQMQNAESHPHSQPRLR